MKRKLLSFLAAILVAALLGGCTGSLPVGGAPINAVHTATPAKLVEPVWGDADTAAEAVATGANDFAFRLSAALAAEAGNENFLCSPYSVWLPLAALVNATDNANRPALLAALGAAGITAEDVNRAASRMLYNLTNVQNDDEPDPLRIANLLLVSDKEQPNKDFAKLFADFYRGAVMSADFSSQTAVDTINRWASDNTEGLIDSVIQELDPNAVAVLANAIYFSDGWVKEFNEDNTQQGVFHAPDGESEAFFMYRGGEQRYYEDEQVQLVPLYFKNGGGLYVLLPKDGNALGLLNDLSADKFATLCSGTSFRPGTLLLPRFSLETDMALKDALVALGVPLFEGAPLTGGLIEGSDPVWISAVTQKAVIEVEEKGTTAAAVTVITAPTAAAPNPESEPPFMMNCNRPFVFVLCGDTYDGGAQVLFTGIVNNPQ